MPSRNRVALYHVSKQKMRIKCDLHQTAKVLGSSHTAKCCSPQKYHDSDELADRKLDQKVCNDRLPDELRDIDNRSKP